MEHIDDDGNLSSMACHSSGSGDGCSATSGESGWTTYIDYFMEAQQQQKQEEASTDDLGRSRSSSSGDHEAQSPLPELVEPSSLDASGRLRWRKKKELGMLYDESLEDTATSPISSPKMIDSRDSCDKHKNKEDACDEVSDIVKEDYYEMEKRYPEFVAHQRP
ncbi:hypothetical protein E2562_026516 [Oryza meyeriana var. granulata]|uniref:Uncharacterized protein n=1 Tax=Oryza meyeriana var. granulata TaxID=110450 RepID=A0A6G1DNP0_9ORYZ|nr:hypothetical protein E2562_026516 [Oryza meyeriana var. granulata]KAF0914121.1 hypothetical protein E2562_026516 [Oryza meyeriana var. granulata]